jgi:hypothetical protein
MALVISAGQRGVTRDVKGIRQGDYTAKPHRAGWRRAELAAICRHQRPFKESADHRIPSMASGKALAMRYIPWEIL